MASKFRNYSTIEVLQKEILFFLKNIIFFKYLIINMLWKYTYFL